MKNKSSNNNYLDLVNGIIDKYNKFLLSKSSNEEEATDIEKSLIGLWSISRDNLYFIMNNIHIKGNYYACVGSTRLILECSVASHKLVKSKNKYAKDFFNNQEKIRSDIEKSRWDAFTSGRISKYGNLSFGKKMQENIEEVFNKDAVGAYNYLCFYTHPNIASYRWWLEDNKGIHTRYLLGINNKILGSLILVLEKHFGRDKMANKWLQQLKDVDGRLEEQWQKQ